MLYEVITQPAWIMDGIEIVKEMANTSIERDVFTQKMYLLDNARKKTTQKVNLYEKVQSPRITSYNVCYTKLLR